MICVYCLLVEGKDLFVWYLLFIGLKVVMYGECIFVCYIVVKELEVIDW